MTNLLDSKLKVDNARAKVENYTWSKRAKEILEFIRNGQHSVSDISSLGVGHVGF